MKFVYEYRTSDNAKHNGVICASDREAAYAELKKKGIRPSRFAEAPGLFNKIFGKGKRWIAIFALAALAVCSLRFALHTKQDAFRTNEVFDSARRRQIIGDPAIIEEGVRNGWSEIFTLEGDRFLASFAIPGIPAAVRSTTEDEIRKALDAPRQSAGSNAVSLEERQIRAIVDGMKDELRTFIADGGSIRQYGRLLVQRQEDEIAYYVRAEKEIKTAAMNLTDAAELAKVISNANVALRKMGIKPVVFVPKENSRTPLTSGTDF